MSAGLSRLRFRCCVFLLLSCAALLPAATNVNSLPHPTGYVSDLANVVDAESKRQLEDFCTRIDHELGVQLALVTIDTLDDAPIENFTLDLARAWGVGAKKDNQGVLLLLAVKDRKSRLEIGRGVEPYVTDGLSGSTLRSMRPDLRAGNYGPALMAGAREIAAAISQGKGIAFDVGGSVQPPEPEPQPQSYSRRRGSPLSKIFFGIVAVIILLNLFRRGGGGGYRRGGGGGGSFLTGFLLSSLLSGGGRRDSGWGGGGGFGGGDSGGGGGFGGFGGGDFGGGGASSDW